MPYAPAETAARLANVLDVLRETVHLTAGQLPLEPRLEVKALLAGQLYDDARAVSKLQRRVEELGAAPGGPGEELTALLDMADAPGALKPALLNTLRAHQNGVDPLADEATLRLLLQLVHRQERHLAELPVESMPGTHQDLGSLPREPGGRRALKVMPPLDRPARDAFVRVVNEEPETSEAHSLLDAKLCAAELLARTSHEHPDMPWEFHVDMARACRDALRHAELVDRLMTTELGSHWGAHPVTFAGFRAVYALDLSGRLEALDGAPTTYAPGSPAFDHVRADDAARTRATARWRNHN